MPLQLSEEARSLSAVLKKPRHTLAVHPAPRTDPLPACVGADARGMQQADACLASGARREVWPYFQDVLDHVRRVETRVGGLREILTSVFEAANLLEQQRQGVIARQLAAWAAILAVPTAIAGIYGINFANMPELKTDYGYFIVLGVIALLWIVRPIQEGEVALDRFPPFAVANIIVEDCATT
jgi:Mg2+ and Co2+ transporter CorA